MIAKTTTRVEENTPEELNQKIRRRTQNNVRLFSKADRDILKKRLQELDEEWDMERVLETNASALMLFGAVKSLKNRFWLFLPFGVAAFLLQHALQGWCPPLAVLRALGFRTSSEINQERTALERLRKLPSRRAASRSSRKNGPPKKNAHKSGDHYAHG